VHSQTKELAISHECVGVNNSLDVLRDAAVNIMIIDGWYFSSHAVILSPSTLFVSLPPQI
jgi:hypothetical protein